jgi:hypothetical protein
MRLLVVLLLMGIAMTVNAAERPYPAPSPAEDTSSYGRHIQRTMTLMESSTPEKRNTVRILYYGQSIMGQEWSEDVDAYLRERYPNTDFVTANLALGGFSSQRLVRTMHYDVFPFYPDLFVFHVFGSHIEYENIIREVRQRTSAEVLMQLDHMGAKNADPEPRKASVNEQASWDGKMNHWYLPEFARKYGCALQPQRAEWLQ